MRLGKRPSTKDRVAELEAANAELVERVANLEAGLRVAGAALCATGHRDAERN